MSIDSLANRGPTIQRMLKAAFRRYSDEVCLRWEGGTASFAETGERTSRVGHWISQHVRAPGHVAILLPNSREYVEAILACSLAGHVRVPLSMRDPLDVSRAKIERSQSSVLITTPGMAEELASCTSDNEVATLIVGPHYDGSVNAYRTVVETGTMLGAEASSSAAVGDRYRLSFTGGTTGEPKAVVQTHFQERAMIRNLLLEAVSPNAGSCFIAATPLSHAAGAFVMPTLLAGGSVGWLEKFDSEQLASPTWNRERHIEIESFVVPTVLGSVAEAPGAGDVFRTLVYGGAPCPDNTLDTAVGHLGDALVQVYGQAEAPVTICIATGDDHVAGRVRQGWVGWPFKFVEVSTPDGSDEGELIVHGEHVMSGYWNQPDATKGKLTPDGGVRTEDLVRVGEAGDISIIGRARDIIISGGFNVYPGDVERRLSAASELQGLAVFGIPHPRWGEAVVAVIEAPDVSDAELIERASQQAEKVLADFERPKHYFTLEALPLTPLGKVSKSELVDRFGDHFSAGRGG